MAVTEFAVASAVVGGFIILFGYVSLFIKEKLYLSEAFVATLIGVIFGPAAAGIIKPAGWGPTDVITLEFTRVVIAVQVMAAGVALPKAYLWKELRSLAVLLVPVMTYMWLVSGLAIWLLIPGMNFLEALVIASCVAPTDPVLANSIVKGRFAEKHVPPHVRNILSAESGANDGLGFPFLLLAVYLLEYSSVGEAIGRWIYMVLLYQIALSIVIGFIVGFVARKLLYYARKRGYIDKESFISFAVALSFFIVGVVTLIGSDDLLACFIAGNSFTWDDWFRRETEDAHIQEVVDMLLNLTVFVYIGATMPWSSFADEALGISIWRLVVLAIVIILFRRLPAVLAFYKTIPAVVTFREAVFSGYFGPIGVGAIFYAMVAKDELHADGPHARAHNLITPVVYFLVLSSVIVHGITVPLLHLGTRIATRTLTRSSMVTDNQVLRLPKLRIGQSLSREPTLSVSKEDEQKNPEEKMDQQQLSQQVSREGDERNSASPPSSGEVVEREEANVQNGPIDVVVYQENHDVVTEDREGYIVNVVRNFDRNGSEGDSRKSSAGNGASTPGQVSFALGNEKKRRG
ncbi:uncharacterized protein VTP21DRAFT_7249 [Calcarisporiella thermophila]|uniref:uncharacterized protein n=1 Tax=Calcarisporiella thermophila TaxID=911321 RepID=UPI0037441E83